MGLYDMLFMQCLLKHYWLMRNAYEQYCMNVLVLISKLEGRRCNYSWCLSCQAFVYTYVRATQSAMDTSLVASKSYLYLLLWPVVALYIFITFWILDSGCFQFFIALVAVSSVTDWGRLVHHFLPPVPVKSLQSTRMLGKIVSVTQKWRPGNLFVERHWSLNSPLIAQLLDAVAFYTDIIMALRDNGDKGQ